MVDKVTLEDVEEYIANEYDETIHSVSDPRVMHLPDNILFEAFSERAVDQNPDYDIRSLTERWNEEYGDSDISKYEFAVKVFNELVSNELYEKMSHKDKDIWIEATVQGLSEINATK